VTQAAQLLLLLGSNQRPGLHLALAVEALDRVFPISAELGRCRAAAVDGVGTYDNRLLACDLPALLAEPSCVDHYCRMLEASVARRSGEACPIDFDPFLIRHPDGNRVAFKRTPKVLALLARLDPQRRLGLPDWACGPA
jgi:hypothetical protein